MGKRVKQLKDKKGAYSPVVLADFIFDADGKNPISALDKKIADALSKIGKINDAISSLAGEVVEQLSSEFESIREEVSSLNTEVSTIKTDVSTIKTEMPTIKTDVSTIKTDIAELEFVTASSINDLVVRIKEK